MILKASQRSGGRSLGRHLLNTAENDHVEVLEIRGVLSDENVTSALIEMENVSAMTKCKKPLYSLSLSPPENADIKQQDYLKAINQVERTLGLKGQPRAIVLHEKEGRQHVHCVWSRIDVENKIAIPISYDRLKLKDISRQLYREHNWNMPPGLIEKSFDKARHFDLWEYNQAKRSGIPTNERKKRIAAAWDISDDRKSFSAALETQGYVLCRGAAKSKGAQIPFLVLDIVDLEPVALNRATGLKHKQMMERLGDPAELPTFEQVKGRVLENRTEIIKGELDRVRDSYHKELKEYRALVLDALKEQQLAKRESFRSRQAFERKQNEEARARKYTSGLLGVFDKLTGKRFSVRQIGKERVLEQRRQGEDLQAFRLEQRAERQEKQSSLKNIQKRYVAELDKIRFYASMALGMENPAVTRLINEHLKEQQEKQKREQAQQTLIQQQKSKGLEL